MLKHIPAVLPPDLVKYMMEMGHGDTLVIADAHFPAHSCGQRVVNCCGVGAEQLLDAILQLMPLDRYVPAPITLMQLVEGETIGQPPIWGRYRRILAQYQPLVQIQWAERFAYYEMSRRAYVIVQSGETAQYANILLQKGVVV